MTEQHEVKSSSRGVELFAKRVALGLLLLAGTMILARLLWYGIPPWIAGVFNVASPACVLSAVGIHLWADTRS